MKAWLFPCISCLLASSESFVRPDMLCVGVLTMKMLISTALHRWLTCTRRKLFHCCMPSPFSSHSFWLFVLGRAWFAESLPN